MPQCPTKGVENVFSLAFWGVFAQRQRQNVIENSLPAISTLVFSTLSYFRAGSAAWAKPPKSAAVCIFNARRHGVWGEVCKRTLFKDSLGKLLNGSNKRIPQDNTNAIYYPNGSINFDECEIDFNKSTYMLYNWIRAFIFPPFQYPIFQYEEKWEKVVEANPIYNKNKFEKPGSLVKRNNNKFVFSTQDCYVELKTE